MLSRYDMASCLFDVAAIKLVWGSRECGAFNNLRPISLLILFLVSAGPEGVEESCFGGVS